MIKSCFYCKICWRGKMFFYTVSFPSAVDVFLGCPEAGFLIFILHARPPEDTSLDLQSRAERNRERRGGGEKRPSRVVRPRPHAPPATPFPRSFLAKPRCQRPADASVRLEKGALYSHARPHQGAPGLAARSPTATHSWEKHMQ